MGHQAIAGCKVKKEILPPAVETGYYFTCQQIDESGGIGYSNNAGVVYLYPGNGLPLEMGSKGTFNGFYFR
jgi:hypothetical protein